MGALSPVYVELVDTRPESTPGYLGTLVLCRSNGYGVQEMSISLPEMRVVANPRADGHGTDDQTAWFGSRAVNLVVGIIPELAVDPAATEARLVRAIGRYLVPGLRPVLRYRQSESDDLVRIRLRADQGSYTDQWTSSDFLVLSLGWVAPEGRIEAAEATVLSIPATATIAVAGRAYSRTGNRTYPSGSAAGSGARVANDGDQAIDPIIRLYGPCTAPKIENLTTGAALVFDASLSLAAGEFLTVDTRYRTVHLNGDPTMNRYRYLKPTSTRWDGLLVPGMQTIRFAPSSAGAGSEAIVEFRPAYML